VFSNKQVGNYSIWMFERCGRESHELLIFFWMGAERRWRKPRRVFPVKTYCILAQISEKEEGGVFCYKNFFNSLQYASYSRGNIFVGLYAIRIQLSLKTS
jgi:hypothetical protein